MYLVYYWLKRHLVFDFLHSIVVELAKGTRRESGRDRDNRDSRGRRDDRRPRRNENG